MQFLKASKASNILTPVRSSVSFWVQEPLIASPGCAVCASSGVVTFVERVGKEANIYLVDRLMSE